MKIVIVIIVSLLLIEISNANYHTVDGTKYFVSIPLMKNWYQAQQYCRFNGMHAISIHTVEEHKLILDVIGRTTNSTAVHFWTSGTDLGHAKKEYFWHESGYPVVYSNWMTGHPSDAVYQQTTLTYDCLLLHAGYNYKYYNEYCLYKHYFICQDRLVLPDALRYERCQHN